MNEGDERDKHDDVHRDRESTEEVTLTEIRPVRPALESERRAQPRRHCSTPLDLYTDPLPGDHGLRKSIDTCYTGFGHASSTSSAESDRRIGSQVDLGVEVVLGLHGCVSMGQGDWMEKRNLQSPGLRADRSHLMRRIGHEGGP
jgi:hypothetical protein